MFWRVFENLLFLFYDLLAYLFLVIYVYMSKKILFVEDDEGFYNIFSVPLKMKGYDVLRVSDGSSAVDKVIVKNPI